MPRRPNTPCRHPGCPSLVPYGTIEPNPAKNTPVLVWEISRKDEQSLDRYEGFPSFYYKKDLDIEVFPVDGGEPVRITAMVYIMDEKHICSAPSPFYYKVLEDGYEAFHFPRHVLKQALIDSIGSAGARLFLERGASDGKV